MTSEDAGWSLLAYTIIFVVCLTMTKCVLIDPIERSIDRLTVAVEKVHVVTTKTNK